MSSSHNFRFTTPLWPRMSHRSRVSVFFLSFSFFDISVKERKTTTECNGDFVGRSNAPKHPLLLDLNIRIYPTLFYPNKGRREAKRGALRADIGRSGSRRGHLGMFIGYFSLIVKVRWRKVMGLIRSGILDRGHWTAGLTYHSDSTHLHKRMNSTKNKGHTMLTTKEQRTHTQSSFNYCLAISQIYEHHLKISSFL